MSGEQNKQPEHGGIDMHTYGIKERTIESFEPAPQTEAVDVRDGN